MSIHCGVTSNLRIGLARRTRIGMKRIYVLQNNLTPSCRHSLKLNLEFPIMEIKLRHRVWRDLSNILFAEVKGPGLNSYRTTSIRLMLTVMRRIGWVQHKHISHFEMVLWQNATDAIENGLWVGSKRMAIRYYFWRFVSTEAGRVASDIGTSAATPKTKKAA